MNAALQIQDEQEFFAPASTDMVDGLIGRYRQERVRMERVCEFLIGDDFRSVVSYFEDAARRRDYRAGSTPSFKLDQGLAALDASYWSQALNLTDVLDFMPTKRREEWFDSIQKMEAPEFEESTVRATLRDLLSARMDFLAEKVDGIFRALSKTHVTNQPEGFSKRMILTGVTNDWGGYGRSQTGHINDLRQVIAKFMSRDEPDWNASNRMVEICRAHFRGDWVPVDGGALRVRCYLNGNAHIEVHPDIAWRLNEILHHLYPMAIPSRFRQKPKRKVKEFTLMDRPLPFAVLEVLHRMKPERHTEYRNNYGERRPPRTTNPYTMTFDFPDRNSGAAAEIHDVLLMLGGVKINDWYEFDYNVKPIIKEVVCSGCIPDQKSHQFYPTPEQIALDAVEIAEISPEHHCLEPSAGTGKLADHMHPCGSITCVEISELHAQILQEKGFFVDQSDFLAFTGSRFDRIVMNPPYSQGRWQAHISHAETLLSSDGVMVAILPSSAKGKDVLPGMDITWSKVYENQFRGASVNVVIMRAEFIQ